MTGKKFGRLEVENSWLTTNGTLTVENFTTFFKSSGQQFSMQHKKY